MKNVLYFTVISATLLFASCSKEYMGDTTTDVKTYSPIVQGVIGEFTDAKVQTGTRTGVVEDNPNYADGEKFYWHNGDKAKVLFFSDGNLSATPIELTYTATVAEGVKSNTCQFNTTGSIPAGNYKVFALYPADGWSKDVTGYKASFPALPGVESNIIPFYEASSEHLKDYMFMKADVGSVTISDEGNNAINFSFKHLTSVIRFHVTSDYNATSMTPSSPLILSEKTSDDFFYTKAYLNSIEGMDLTPVLSSKCSQLILSPTDYYNFIKKDGATWEFDFYMPVFPTKANTSGMKLTIEADIRINGNASYQQHFGTNNGLSFTKELSFMPNGFEAGKSYYFNLKAEIW